MLRRPPNNGVLPMNIMVATVTPAKRMDRNNAIWVIAMPMADTTSSGKGSRGERAKGRLRFSTIRNIMSVKAPIPSRTVAMDNGEALSGNNDAMVPLVPHSTPANKTWDAPIDWVFMIRDDML